VYTELVPAFERLLAESASLEDFYRRVKELAAAQQPERDAYFRKEGYPRPS
jgi:predicted aminopeptidase